MLTLFMHIMRKLITKVFNRLDIIIVKTFQLIRKWRYQHEGVRTLDVGAIDNSNNDFVIIITTFEARFFNYAIPLVSEIRGHIDTPIFLVINGNYEKISTNNNLRNLLLSLVKFINIYPITFANLRGCSALWNAGIDAAESRNYLVLNDDIHLIGSNLQQEISHLRNLLQENGLVTINNTFSHFAISEQCISKVGLFDEHFLGFGHEDVDYMHRYRIAYNKDHHVYKSSSFFNLSDASRDPHIASQGSESKYSLFNLKMIKSLYKVDEENGIQSAFDKPMSRISPFVNPRPLAGFREKHYKDLTD
jgi:hypothetical protein